ncbi:putative N6-adenine methyltransferase-domain-containing protein [Thermothelomyces heterothallicus CBS 202.75]|uniref:putative N6-adenine methyltransferase-domain-containing protein n=1 Tax=Thermothelomyces heterothallicus CBS 202.75 TaxID=1149848 RepID=UPI0037443996
MASRESDDEISLSSTTLNALKEFYAERDARAEQFAKLQARADALHAAAEEKVLSMDAFAEDWNESQFWYADETAGLYAKLLLEGVTENTTIAVVSAPSVFVALKNALSSAPPGQPKPNLILLEHDQRFAIFPEFVYYDFAQPLKLPAHLKGTCDRIIADPPFLSEDCQTKTALTVRWLSRPPSASTAPDQSQGEPCPQPRLILSTGERMKDIVTRVYRSFGLRTTDYEPKHARGLSNEFYCYANFECEGWGWRE